jgi:hypothetical protein
MAVMPNIVPSVAMIGEIISQLARRPLSNPIAAPTASPAAIARGVDEVASATKAEAMAPARNDAPTDRSMPPAINTKATKHATMITKLEVRRMFVQVSACRNRGLRVDPPNTRTNMTMTTGSARLPVILVRQVIDVDARGTPPPSDPLRLTVSCCLPRLNCLSLHEGSSEAR